MTTSSPDKNELTVRRLYEQAINEGRFDLFPELVADDYVGASGERGPQGFAATATQLRSAISGLRFVVEETVAADDRVVVRWTWSGRHTGALFGVPPTGKPIVNTGIVIYRLRDAKVVSASLQVDRLGVLQQIGVVPTDIGRRPAPAPEAAE